MKNNVLIGVFVSIIAFFSLSNNYQKHKKFRDNISAIDTVKVVDSVVSDTIDLKYEMFQEDAHASYYHDRFTGRRTASGAIFNNNELTCAHKKLPFGTKIKVTSIKTGKSVIVTVTDRGPFVKGRHIDLSKKAFMLIAPDRYGGHIRVNIELIKEN
jgi:rare lipoprotein A